MTTQTRDQRCLVVEKCTRLSNDILSKKNDTGLIKQDAQSAHSFIKRPVSSGLSQLLKLCPGVDEAILIQNEDNEYQLCRENTCSGTGKRRKLYTFVQFKACSKDKSSNNIKDPNIRLFRLRCKMECFPLLQRNLKFALDIEKQFRYMFGNGDGNNVPKSPRILDQQELTLYIATDSDVDDISQEVSAIMGNHAYSEKKEVTEKCFKKDCKSVTPDQDCPCLILFLDKDETNITVLESSNVLYVPSPSLDVEIIGQSQSVRVFREETVSPWSIRRKLTHILGADLFSYAEEVQQRLGEYEETIKSPNLDQITMLRNTKEAVTVLLTRRVLPDCETSATGGSTKFEIPEDIDSALNRMKNCGVIAFGLFVDGFVVFIDEECSDQVHTETTEEIINLCSNRPDFKILSKVIKVSQDFLTDTGLEQGHKLINGSEWGSIGMVTRATKKPIATETTKEAGGPTHSEQETPKHIVVAITAGHLFKENDDAFFVRNDKNEKFGKCLAKLHRKGHISTKKYDIAVIELDENMKTSEDCDAKFRNENGESCDGVLFKGTLASGTVMYKKGAATGMSAGVVVSPDFRLVGHDDTQKGYLIKGRDDRDFANLGDSGSIVFTLDTNDEENRTVNLVSIVTKTLSKDLARIPEIPGTLAYIVRLDRCLEQLEKLTGVAVHMPKK